MRVWKAVLLIDLALLVGVGWGYAFWGLREGRLERELAEARAAATSGIERRWVVEGVVRAIFPELGVIVLTATFGTTPCNVNRTSSPTETAS